MGMGTWAFEAIASCCSTIYGIPTRYPSIASSMAGYGAAWHGVAWRSCDDRGDAHRIRYRTFLTLLFRTITCEVSLPLSLPLPLSVACPGEGDEDGIQRLEVPRGRGALYTTPQATPAMPRKARTRQGSRRTVQQTYSVCRCCLLGECQSEPSITRRRGIACPQGCVPDLCCQALFRDLLEIVTRTLKCPLGKYFSYYDTFRIHETCRLFSFDVVRARTVESRRRYFAVLCGPH